jgi:hypothetical protein
MGWAGYPRGVVDQAPSVPRGNGTVQSSSHFQTDETPSCADNEVAVVEGLVQIALEGGELAEVDDESRGR